MERLQDDYCSYEISKMLQEKGFNIEVGGMYVDKDNNFVHASLAPLKVKDYEKVFDDQFTPTCTHQIAMKFLREMHNIFIIIEPHMYDYINERNSSYVYSIWVGDNYYENPTSTNYPTYEKTVDAALKLVLKNLI